MKEYINTYSYSYRFGLGMEETGWTPMPSWVAKGLILQIAGRTISKFFWGGSAPKSPFVKQIKSNQKVNKYLLHIIALVCAKSATWFYCSKWLIDVKILTTCINITLCVVDKLPQSQMHVIWNQNLQLLIFDCVCKHQKRFISFKGYLTRAFLRFEVAPCGSECHLLLTVADQKP